MFEPGDDVVGARRDEDRRAAKVLHASTRHLDHWDHQYRDPAYGYDGPAAGLAGSRRHRPGLPGRRAQPSNGGWSPSGILHPDHQVTAEACLIAVGQRPDVEWLVYEELPYATIYPKERRRRRRCPATTRFCPRGGGPIGQPGWRGDQASGDRVLLLPTAGPGPVAPRRPSPPGSGSTGSPGR